MALTKTTFRARTRGKSPKAFTFEGFGAAKERQVQDKDGNPIVLDKSGNPIEYSLTKKDGKYTLTSSVEGMTADEKGNISLPEGYSFVLVDDADVESIAPKAEASPEEKKAFLGEVLQQFGGDMREMGIYALIGLNGILRDKAAEPFRTVTQKEDELAEIVSLIKAKGLFKDDAHETKWRRSVTMGADVTGMPKLDFAYSTKEGKQVERPSA